MNHSHPFSVESFALSGVYNMPLVLLSIVIAVVSAYAAIELTTRITMARGRTRISWLVGGAIALGTGIWAMHYIGMIAFRLPVPVYYHLPTVLASLFIAIAASFVGLSVVSAPRLTPARTLFGGITMGGGIAAMHYVGMAAMRVSASFSYSPLLVACSILAAVLMSCLALRMIFALRSELKSWTLRKAGGALLLGLAIPSMHYIGMAAVHFQSAAVNVGHLDDLITNSNFDRLTLVLVVFSILALAIISSGLDRRIAFQASELALSRQQLQDLFDNMAEAFVVLDVPSDTLQSNRPAMELLGIPYRLATRKEARTNFELLDRNNNVVAFEDLPLCKALEGVFLENAEYTVRRTDIDRSIFTEVSTRPVFAADGSVRQLFVTYRDISERMQNTDTRARLAAIMNSTEDAIISVDEAGKVRSWNAAAERIYGYSAAEMLGNSIRCVVPPERMAEERDFFDKLRRGQVLDHVETIRRHKSGKSIHLLLSIAPILDSHGRFTGVSGVARDITEKRLFERQLQRTHKMQAIGELTGGIAHDFNNLLGVIVGNLSLLETMASDGVPGPNPEIFNRLRIAQRAASRGSDLTRRLLTFSSTGELDPVASEVETVIHDALELAARTLGPEIHVTSRIAENMPHIFVDPSAMEGAILNLMVNARDAMPKGGTISILSELVDFDETSVPVRAGELKPGQYASISVTDSGVGMSAQTLERALEPFFTTKARGKGTGLGLPMVYGFARQSGGAVRIYSELGHGTTVTLYVRLAGDAVLPSHVEHTPLEATNSEHKVLVVDDEPELLDIAIAYLRRMGFHSTFEARNGSAALDIIRANPDIDLVITDVIMPGINGAELVEHIRQFIPSVRVIYSSGFPADALTERSGTAIDGHLLRKPYQRVDFETVVRHVLENTCAPTCTDSHNLVLTASGHGSKQ